MSSAEPSSTLPVGRPRSRREFVQLLAGGTALSLTGLDRASAAVYEGIDALNRQVPPGTSPDGPYWEAVRRFFKMPPSYHMMNNGTVGPMPEPVFNTLVKHFRVQVTDPCRVYSFQGSKREELRRNLASFIGADPDEVVLTRNTTEGMNFIASGLDMEPGDEVIISTMEHPAGRHPWYLKQARRGIRVVDVPIGLPPGGPGEIVAAFEEAITPRTRIISLSHTVYISGLIAPLKELSRLARSRDILLLADSAHGLGMLDMDMHELGIDYLTSSPYKWLGAPTGCGLLYMRKEAQAHIWPTIASSGWDREGSARRFETLGQRAEPLLYAFDEALDFQNRIGRDRIERRIRTLASRLKEGLREIPGAHLHTSMDPYLSGGLTAFSVEGVSPSTIVDYLRERYNIIIRTIGSASAGTAGVRVSTHYFVRDEAVEQVLEGVRHLVGV